MRCQDGVKLGHCAFQHLAFPQQCIFKRLGRDDFFSKWLGLVRVGRVFGGLRGWGPLPIVRHTYDSTDDDLIFADVSAETPKVFKGGEVGCSAAASTPTYALNPSCVSLLTDR